MATTPLYLFVHLFKTGGTTINGHLARHLAWDDEFVHLGPWGDRVRERDESPDPASWPPMRWERVRVVAGHRVDGSTHTLAPDREARYLTILRDPADLLVSRYNFARSRTNDPAGFWDWYERRSPNRTVRRLTKAMGVESLPALIEVLNGFWFIGATEYLDHDLPHVFANIGVPTSWVNRRVTGGGADLEDLDIGRDTFPIEQHVALTETMKDRLHTENAKDLKLYRYALKRRREIREDLGW